MANKQKQSTKRTPIKGVYKTEVKYHYQKPKRKEWSFFKKIMVIEILGIVILTIWFAYDQNRRMYLGSVEQPDSIAVMNLIRNGCEKRGQDWGEIVDIQRNITLGVTCLGDE